jgi:hypothetical protein
MLVLIDESGCPGFKIARGSDPVFGIGMVIFENGQAARDTELVIQGLHEKLCHKPEFKFSKCSQDVRDRFFSAVSGCPFAVRALIVNKGVLYSPHLRANPDQFYNYFVKQLMAFDSGILQNARVRIDGSGDREFQRALGHYLRRELGGKVKDVKMSDSCRDQLMQLADMCIGAITRSERPRKDAQRWHRMLRPRIANVWHYR